MYCTDEKNNRFIVELQRSPQKYFKDRSVYYTSFPIQEQAERGDWDYSLRKVFFVGILDFKMNDHPDYLTKVQLYDMQKQSLFFDKLAYYYLEMPKFTKRHAELSNHLDYWLYYLNNVAQTQSIPPPLKKDSIIKQAFNVAEFLALSHDERFNYQRDLKAKLDYKNVMDYAQEQAKQSGIEEGLEKGIEKGIETNKIETVSNAYQLGLSIENIVKITCLTQSEVEKIIQEFSE